MPWWKLGRESGLRDYYVGFAVMWPPLLLIPMIALRLIFGLTMSALAIWFVSLLVLMILAGAPLLHWAHKRSMFTGNPRPLVLAVELMFVWGLAPFGYLTLVRDGLDLWPAVGTLLILFSPLGYIYWRPPRRVYERLRSESEISGKWS